MAYEIDGKTIEHNEGGFLVSIEDWSEKVAEHIAEKEGLSLTDKHWDLINYLRNEFISNGGNQPNTRNIVKDMGKKWGAKISQKDIYDLFPGNPSKQAGMIGGLPESRRKGGY
jgi:tRNA 2-thiouridine synthesizing protein E